MNRQISEACRRPWTTLAELVEDPLVRLMMKSDGVDRRSIERLFERLARERPTEVGQTGGAAAVRRGL